MKQKYSRLHCMKNEAHFLDGNIVSNDVLNINFIFDIKHTITFQFILILITPKGIFSHTNQFKMFV